MKIDSIIIKNVKSFKNKVRIDFNEDINVLIGPNGGGKSNLLDIITIVVRSFFLSGYYDPQDDQNPMYQDQFKRDLFIIPEVLEKFAGDYSDSNIEITFEVSSVDMKNMDVIKNNIENFETVNQKYHLMMMSNDIREWDNCLFYPGQKITYKLENLSYIGGPVGPIYAGTPESIFLQYLNNYNAFNLLAKEMHTVNLNNNYLYFSPYRIDDFRDNLEVSLANDNFYNLLKKNLQSNSKKTVSLLDLATFYFAEKMRKYETQTKNYLDKWFKDPEVKLINTYLGRLGYTWKIDLKDYNKNIYEAVISKNGKEFRLGQASSGEKELFNFLFGIFAFNIRDGLIIVDEPELHLHPKWQVILLDLCIDLARNTHNQFILSTHSPIFINNDTVSNVLRIYKAEDDSSKIVKIGKNNLKTKDLFHMINSHNNEKMFFADKVVLVEGIHDKLIFEKLIDFYLTFKNDPSIIEVLEVRGKHELLKYREFLNNIGVKNFIIADLDYLSVIGDSNIKSLLKTNYKKIDKAIKSKSSKDGEKLAEELENAIQTRNIDELEQLWEYIKLRNTKIYDSLNDIETKLLMEFISNIESDAIFILRNGELEDYLPEGFKDKDLSKIIDLIKDENFFEWWGQKENFEEKKELEAIVLKIIEDLHY